jgi:5,10-methylene-tetrahydrofolate dehydrogenase/methenyl tetrahydrofolate cyclohydrolase
LGAAGYFGGDRVAPDNPMGRCLIRLRGIIARILEWQEHKMDDKLALVTGASSGIGLELAKDLASRGYDVLIASAGERLNAAAEEIRQCGQLVVAVNADLASRDGVDQL